MFGCCVAGRPLDTNFQQVDETRIVFQLPSASTINHICVFLLGTVPLPDGCGATVHLFWPGRGFQLLGMLSNEKSSAIFRLRGTFIPEASNAAHRAFTSRQTSTSMIASDGDVIAVLGLSIEPLGQIQQQLSLQPVALPPVASASGGGGGSSMSVDTTATLVQKIVRHLINYISGFADQGFTPASMTVIANWYKMFMGKVQAGGLGFLENVE